MDSKEKIRKGENVLRLKLKDNKISESPFDLMKIPIEFLYEKALCEIREQESYIEELKDVIQKLQKEICELNYQNLSGTENKAVLKETRKEELYIQLKDQLSVQRQKNKELRKRVDELIVRVVSYKRIITNLQKQLGENSEEVE